MIAAPAAAWADRIRWAGRSSTTAYASCGPNIVGVVQLPRGQRDPLTGWFNMAAFARPARGDYGSAPRHMIQRPGITNWDSVAVQEHSRSAGEHGGTSSIGVEAYNVLEITRSFREINRNAMFLIRTARRLER